MTESALKSFLDEQVDQFNRPAFIQDDPISIPKAYTKKQDIEIAGLFAAVFSWGNRITILRKAQTFLTFMGDSPYDFVLNHKVDDLRPFDTFVHRTFQPADARWTLTFLKQYYRQHDSLETAFLPGKDLKEGLIHFHELFFANPDAPSRTKKHFPTPLRNASCKRLNMYLRWMVRRDDRMVDFGLWKQHNPALLYCPLDLHVHRIATDLGLIVRKQADWKTTAALTKRLRRLDPKDPAKFDFALFGLGISEKSTNHSMRY